MTRAQNGKGGLKKVGEAKRVSIPVGNVGKPRPILKYGLSAFAGLILVGALAAFLFWQSLYQGMPKLPDTDQLWTANREPAMEFLAADGTTLAIRGPRYGRSVSLAELPPHVPRAFIAAEDKRFYLHDGADTQAMVRAAVINAMSGRTVSGASTLTQQLIKNLVLSPEQTLKRKVQEIRLARQLEERLSKDEILELYLNRVYFGSGFYGLGAATRFYFGKEPRDLTLAEASLLATLPQAPSRLALNRNMDDARKRQIYVLTEMVQAGFITGESAMRAINEEITLAEAEGEDPQYGYILDAAAERAGELLPELPDDVVITLTIDTELQGKVAEAINARMETDGAEATASQASALLIDRGGEVLALYGGRDYTQSQFNRATMAKRQPGSAFKPFVYAAALEAGATPYDILIDEPVEIDDWKPKNFTRDFKGPVTLSEALKDSLNTVAALLGHDVGEDAIINTARRFGVTSELRPLPSISLGSQELTLWELTRAYGPFMTAGNRVDPYIIAKIEDSRGDVIYERPEYTASAVYPPEKAKLMTAMLFDVVEAGTGGRAKVEGWQIGGKTGTSQSSRDAWFVGFSADILAGVWTGNDDDTPMKDVTGGTLPADIWSDIMTIAHEGRSPNRLAGADTLVTMTPEQMARVEYYRRLTMAFAETQTN